MDRPWFTASPCNFAIGMLLMDPVTSSMGRVMPLQEGERRLGWFILPAFQRPAVWTRQQQVLFIESIWAGLPIGVWIYNRLENQNSQWDGVLLDGQQRIGAILAYVNNEFRVHGYLWSELTDIDRRCFAMFHFASLETHIDDEARLRDIYNRLAYGGTPHAAADRDTGRRTSYITYESVQYAVDLEDGVAVKVTRLGQKARGEMGEIQWQFGGEKNARILHIIFAAENDV